MLGEELAISLDVLVFQKSFFTTFVVKLDKIAREGGALDRAVRVQ